MGPRERSLSKYSKIIMLVPPLRGADGRMHAPFEMDGLLMLMLQELHKLGPDGELLVGTYCDACFLLSEC
jgi:hypothetical protein